MPDEFSRLTRRVEHLEQQLDLERQERKIQAMEIRQLDKKQERQEVIIEEINKSLKRIEDDTTFIRKRLFGAMITAAGGGVVGLFFWAIQKAVGG